jgi:glutathione S-transferase
MTAEALGVEYNFKELNIMAGENKTPEYLAINPMHNIPAIVDGDFKGQSRKISLFVNSAQLF